MKSILLLFSSILLASTIQAQHKHHSMPMLDSATKKDTIPPKKNMDEMEGMDMQDHGQMNMEMKGMSHSYSLSLPMNRNGSGTAWAPDNNPMYMLMKHTKKGMWMLHGSVFLRYNNQQLSGKTSRSGQQFDAPNWFMAMYNRPVGKNGLFNFSAMISLDPLTVTERGYPLLFQSGESYQGRTLVDRQHPHDLFSGLSIGYTQRLSKDVDVFGYFGYPGEPAISAPTFMHRTIALNDPDAPLGHHWQDATHITFGVATAGVRVGKVKAEFSSFTGREPNEKRYDFDKMRFDSYSWRLSYNPTKALAVQFSQGYLKSPELLHPNENVWRYTSSVLYVTPMSANGSYFSSALVWGMNDQGKDHREHSLLAEASQQIRKQAVYGRYEFVQKSTEELDLEDTMGELAFDIHKFSLGTNRILFNAGPVDVLGGVQASVNFPPPSLQTLYGKMPLSGQIYIQLRPRLMRH